MWNSWTAVVPAALLFWVTVLGNLDRSLAELNCGSTERQVRSIIPDTEGRLCPEIWSMTMEAQYDNEIVDACVAVVSAAVQNNKPVTKYKVAGCKDPENGDPAFYTLDMCCQKPDPEAMLCYHCADYESEEDCILNSPTVTQCDVDEQGNPQVCRIDIQYQGLGKLGVGLSATYKTYCSPKSECENARDSANCDSSSADADCVVCSCTDQLCNEDLEGKLPFTYAGPVCTSPDPAHGPCQNGGGCSTNGKGELSCDCTGTGYTGEFCEIESMCNTYDNLCMNGGICVDQEQDPYYKCYCRVGYKADDCTETYNTCESNHCENGGTCFLQTYEGEEVKRCRCQDGFLGDLCQEKRRECAGEIFTKREPDNWFFTGNQRNCDRETTKQHEKTGVNKWCPNSVKNKADKDNKSRQNYRQIYEHAEDGRNYTKSEEKTASLSYCEVSDGVTFAQVQYCCPVCMSLPCYNGGYCLEDAEEESGYVCVCRHGYSGKLCELENGICMVSGDPHHKTFDGLQFSMQAAGTFIFAQTIDQSSTDSFRMTVNTEREGLVSYARSAQIEVCGKVVEFTTQDSEHVVTVNGDVIHPADNPTDDCTKFSMWGEFVMMEIVESGVKFGHNFDTTFFVEAPASMNGQQLLEGLCGDFDGVETNDEKKRDGTPAADIPEFVTEWSIGDVAPTHIDDEDPPCNDETLAKELCKYLTDDQLLKSCFDASTAGALHRRGSYDACYFDVCQMDDTKKAACDIMEGVVLQCKDKNSDVNNWRTITGCELTCTNGRVPHYNKKPCDNTCQDPSQKSNCPAENTDFCGCPDGTVLDEQRDECVTLEECTCVTPEGTAIEVGSSILSADCTTKTSCVAGELATNDAQCADDETCVTDEQGNGVCEQKKQCTATNGQVYESGEDWIEKQTCAVAKGCLEGVVSVNEESDCQPYVEPVCVAECNEIKTFFGDDEIDQGTIVVDSDQAGSFLVTTSVDSDIVLTKTVGAVPETASCKDAKECTLEVMFTPQDSLFDDASLVVVVINGNTRTFINYDVKIELPAGQSPCADSAADVEADSDELADTPPA